jgi:hypothetical protein
MAAAHRMRHATGRTGASLQRRCVSFALPTFSNQTLPAESGIAFLRFLSYRLTRPDKGSYVHYGF